MVKSIYTSKQKYGPTLYDEEEKEYIIIKKHMTYDDIQSIIKKNNGRYYVNNSFRS